MRRPILTAVLGALFPAAALPQGTLTIHHIDVDQGDATLVVTPDSSTLLVDVGLDSKGSVVADLLQSRGMSQVDAFVLTHYDADHYGGVDKLVEAGVSVGEWYDRGEKQHLPESKRRQEQFTEYVDVSSSPIQLSPGMRIDLDPEVSLMVVAANGHVRGAVGKYPINGLDENGYSVALLLSYKGFNYFVGGDLTEEVEERLVDEAALGNLDVYKVSHHGSATSSSKAFLDAIRPEVAIISNGSHGGFNHPRRAVLHTLFSVPGMEVYQTNRLQAEDLDNRGRIVGDNVADEFIGDPESEDSDGTVTIEVEGDSYTVTLPARGTSQSYPIERSSP